MAWVRLQAGRRLQRRGAGRVLPRARSRTYKIPRYWKFVEAFPMTVTGKIQKFKMREMSVEELGLQDAARLRTA